MNTPEPCDTCIHLYADCTQDDNPAYAAECKLDLPMGVMDCPRHATGKKTTKGKEKTMTDKKIITEVTGQQREEVLDLFEPMTAQLGARDDLIVEKIPGDILPEDVDPAIDSFACVRGDGFRVRLRNDPGKENGIYEVKAGTWNEVDMLKSQLEEARERLQEALGELEQVEAICERHGYDNDNGPPVAAWLETRLPAWLEVISPKSGDAIAIHCKYAMTEKQLKILRDHFRKHGKEVAIVDVR